MGIAQIDHHAAMDWPNGEPRSSPAGAAAITRSPPRHDDQAFGATPLSTILPNERKDVYRPPKGQSCPQQNGRGLFEERVRSGNDRTTPARLQNIARAIVTPEIQK